MLVCAMQAVNGFLNVHFLIVQDRLGHLLFQVLIIFSFAFRMSPAVEE